jgi:hypothetical protein
MKKILLIATLVGACGFVRATTINAPSTLISNGLNGNDAYSWGISIAVPNGQVITSAQIDFTSIDLTSSGNPANTGVLYTDLLNSKATGLTTAVDNDAAGDYWTTQYSGANITTIGTKAFAALGTTLTWSYVLTAGELTALNSYLAAGTFNIGIDPDCHFSVGGLDFSYTLGTPKTNSVPDDYSTAFLMIFGLAALAIVRRQLMPAKA